MVSTERATFRSHAMEPRYTKGHRIIILSDSGEGPATNKE